MNHVAQVIMAETIEAKRISYADILNSALHVREYTQTKPETQHIVCFSLFTNVVGYFAKIIGNVPSCAIY